MKYIQPKKLTSAVIKTPQSVIEEGVSLCNIKFSAFQSSLL